MKKFLFFILSFFYFINNQIIAQDTIIPSKNLITEDYQIPAFSLYQKQWDKDFLHFTSITIPFSPDNDVKIILVENNNPFAMPCRNAKIITSYSPKHPGIDLKQNLNDSVFACFDGAVRIAKNCGSDYGNMVVIRHYNGLETVYANLNSFQVEAGELVNAGQLIGLAGKSGRQNIEHLHFEVRFLYEHFDPAKMIDFSTETLISNILALNKNDFTLTNPEETTSNIGAENQTAIGQSYHIVKEGDTLYKISQKYKISIPKICQLNHISENAVLQLGQKIKLQ